MLASVVLLALSALAQGSVLPRQEEGLAFSPPSYPSPWMDPHAAGWEEAYAKAKAFVSQLTLMEKVNLTTGVGWMEERCVGNVGSIPRMGMRGLCLQDGPNGIRLSDYNSVFPSGLTAAATFSRDLIYQRGKAIGAEQKGKGVDVLLAPVAGPLGRAPAGGRNWEGFSPDPYLTGQAMAASIIGTQDAGVIATAKHWVGNEQEHFRQAPEAVGYGYNISESMSSNIDDKTMHELYMWPFADAVHAGVGAVMCSYQQVNNSYGCQNSMLLNGLLKNELGFQGFIMSDWQAQHTGVASAAAGLDMTMPGDTSFNTGVSYWGANLTVAVLNGTMPAWRMDDMAMRIMAAFFKVGMEVDDMPDINFSSWTRDTEGYVHPEAKAGFQVVNHQVDVRDDHAKLIREIGAAGTVLLKNKGGALPLKNPKFVAVVGEDAGPNPAGPNGCDNRGCNDGTLAIGWGSGTSEFPYLVTPDSALQARAVSDGTRYESVLSNYEWENTKKLVSQPNVTAIVFANADAGEGFIAIEDNEGDRANLTLWKNGDDLIRNVSSLCSNTIVVIHSVGPVLVTDWYDSPNITAIVWAGLPGQESGNSLVDVLYGCVNPAGRSPFTWGPTEESYGTKVLYEPNNDWAPQDDFTEGVFIDYRHFDRAAPSADDAGAPIYEFGFGLSYTTFEYSDLAIEHAPGYGSEYTPTTGQTGDAPVFGSDKVSKNLDDYVFPDDEFPYLYHFIYPYVNTSSSLEAASADPSYGLEASEFLPAGATDGSSQPKPPASGPGGGNAGLWDVLYTVTATVTNTGHLAGEEVPQLYLGLPGEGEPVKVLRGFDRIMVQPGESATFKAELTRRDVSSWDVTVQNWVMNEGEIKVWVGSSSRNLPLEGTLS